jgi:SNF2 family DNA or RNA helicase
MIRSHPNNRKKRRSLRTVGNGKIRPEKTGKPPVPDEAEVRDESISESDSDRLEFHRNAAALMPDPADRFPGIAIQVRAQAGSTGQRFCSCRTGRSKTCAHLKDLSRILSGADKKIEAESLYEDFRKSIWYRLAEALAEGSPETPETVTLRNARCNDSPVIEVLGRSGHRLMSYLSQGPDRSRFLERCILSPDTSVPTRGRVIQQLSLLTLTDAERILADRGMKTRRQAMEENFWYRAAYHGYREAGSSGKFLYATIEKNTGEFVLTCRGADGPLSAADIPRHRVKSILNRLGGQVFNESGESIAPLSLDSIFDVRLNEEMDLEIRPMLRMIQKNGEARFFQRENLERFRYGDLYYIQELGILVEDRYPEPPPEKFKDVKTVISKSQVPEFLSEFGTDLEGDSFQVDTQVQRLEIIRSFDRIEIVPDALERDWYWLSVDYGAGSRSVSLSDILRARHEKQRYIATEGGWIDCGSPDLEGLDGLLERLSPDDLSGDESGSVRLARTDVLRLGAVGGRTLSFSGDPGKVASIRKLLSLQPSDPLPELKGMTSTLRRYQKTGTEWLWFLYENRLGGLLCDEMGLGKTHQAMALMTALLESEKDPGPFLVICPTTVISHWHRKIIDHAPVLSTAVYYGNLRDLDRALSENRVILTSYGILRRDAERLAKTDFSLIFFDEIQHLKNPDTLSHRAAAVLRARMKVGLTGTPIENTVTELKALMDLTVPGYLGGNEDFARRYVQPVEQEKNSDRREELGRLISPFVLRRRKASVLDELPDKIEDTMTCRLSDEQVRLYREAVDSRGRRLLAELEEDDTPVPYMHIFAMLNLLKQICNHPALVENRPEDFDRYKSGKWDLFVELLTQILEGGQKVVVFSQYVGMIEIMKRYLTDRKVDFVTLTGASRNRGEIIERFRTDPDCRVYLGSLKAGGTGIDLTSASTVIHYDRWWNAAREDQATDRVHRIGQTRGVQVFKLVTEGTLEEKIGAMIDRKRSLMDSVIQEDDPGLLKTFTREELMQLLALPVETPATGSGSGNPAEASCGSVTR